MTISHADVLESMRGLPGTGDVRYVMLRDRLVTCDVQVRLVTPGSLDALPLTLLAVLKADGPCTLDDLARAVNAGRRGVAAVAEVLGVLERISEVTVTYTADGEPIFALTPINQKVGARSGECVIETSLQYIPRSGQIAKRITGMTGEQLEGLKAANPGEWWNAPDEEALYAEATLPDLARAACVDLYRKRAPLPNIEAGDIRDEVLQRAHLMSPEFVFLDATVLRAAATRFFVVHRCYLRRSTGLGSHDWHILVHQLRRGPCHEGYTRYLRTMVEERHEVLESLLGASQSCN